MLAGGTAGLALHDGLCYFNGVSTLPADQVMVMFLALAAPVAALVVLAAQHIHLALLGLGLQDAVDRGQGDRFPARVQHLV